MSVDKVMGFLEKLTGRGWGGEGKLKIVIWRRMGVYLKK